MKKIIALLLCAITAISLCACNPEGYSRTVFLLNTTVTVTLYGKDRKHTDGILEECGEYEKLLSRTDPDSEIYKLNRQNGPCKVSGETAELIKKALTFYDISGGKFDITVAPVTDLWDFTGDALPKKEDIAAALKNVGAESVKVKGNTVNANGRQLDLGAIAKGYIADRMAESLKSKGIKRAIINLGGNVTVLGKNHTVGVRRPFSDGIIAKVNASDTSVVTSGIYERYIKKDGKIYHHIIDPKTGYAAESDLLSATVICQNSCTADALSTVCMLVGKKSALKIAESTKGVEVLLVDTDYNVTASSGLTLKKGIYY